MHFKTKIGKSDMVDNQGRKERNLGFGEATYGPQFILCFMEIEKTVFEQIKIKKRHGLYLDYLSRNKLIMINYNQN